MVVDELKTIFCLLPFNSDFILSDVFEVLRETFDVMTGMIIGAFLLFVLFILIFSSV